MSVIKVLSSNLSEIDTIDDVLSASRTESINSDNTLSFSVLLTKKNTALFNATNVLEQDGDYFDIAKYKKGQSEDGRLTCDVDCEHVSYRLNNSEYDKEYFTETGSPSEVLTAILSGTGFSVETVEFTSSVTYSAQEKKSSRGLLVQFAEYLGGELLFTGFTVSIVKQRGNAVPRDLISEGCISVISKTFDKTRINDEGNPTVSYECTAFDPEPLSLGDTVLLDYATLDICLTLRIVSLTTHPYDKRQAAFSVSNRVPSIEDEAYKIATSTVMKDASYNGCRIGPDYGFEAVRNDKKARAFFRSDGLKFQSGDGTGDNWTDKIYFDPDSGTYVFDGELSSTLIKALGALITQNLYASKATVSELTVDKLDTSDKVQNYLDSNTADVNYARIYDQYVQFVTATKSGTDAVQATDRNGAKLYWTDETHEAATINETEFPVLMYSYAEACKLQIAFEIDGESGYYIPMLVLGAGTGNFDYGKAYIYKGATGLYIKYLKSTDGSEVMIKLTDEGLDLGSIPKITYAETTVVDGLIQLWVQTATPTAAKSNDLWVKTSDYSRYDVTVLIANQALSSSDNEVLTANGTFTITLHSAATAGIIKKIYNIGTGIVTIAGTINGLTNMYLYPNESVELITDGNGWRY